MSENTEIWLKNMELHKYFATKCSFSTWMGFNFLMQNPSLDEIMKSSQQVKPPSNIHAANLITPDSSFLYPGGSTNSTSEV